MSDLLESLVRENQKRVIAQSEMEERAQVHEGRHRTLVGMPRMRESHQGRQRGY